MEVNHLGNHLPCLPTSVYPATFWLFSSVSEFAGFLAWTSGIFEEPSGEQWGQVGGCLGGSELQQWELKRRKRWRPGRPAAANKNWISQIKKWYGCENPNSNKDKGEARLKKGRNDETKATQLLLRNLRRPRKPLCQNFFFNFIYGIIYQQHDCKYANVRQICLLEWRNHLKWERHPVDQTRRTKSMSSQKKT